MEIIDYVDRYRDQIISLVLHIQNDEFRIGLPLDEQPDLLDIAKSYYRDGGRFFLAVDHEDLVGTLAFMNYGNGNAVLKKFFVRADWRSRKVGLALYERVMSVLSEQGYKCVLLDTPSVAKASHRFYERAGFVRVDKDKLPFSYTFPERDSYLYLLEL